MRRHSDHDFDSAAFLDLLNRLDASLDQAVHLVRYLDDDQLIEAFQASRSIGKRAWLMQAAMLYEAQRRSVYGDQAVEAIARSFGISLNIAEKYARVWREFFIEAERQEIFNVEEIFLDEPSWYVVAATESPKPQKWLAYAQDKKAENPRYSLSDFRREIQQAVGADMRVLEERTPQYPEPAPRIPWDCPWVKPYCIHSGKPVLAEDCRCEAAL
jgi:hypothetical protein